MGTGAIPEVKGAGA